MVILEKSIWLYHNFPAFAIRMESLKNDSYGFFLNSLTFIRTTIKIKFIVNEIIAITAYELAPKIRIQGRIGITGAISVAFVVFILMSNNVYFQNKMQLLKVLPKFVLVLKNVRTWV